MFRVFKSIVYILLLIPTVGLSRGNDVEALVSHHFTSFPTTDSLDTQAMMHERACAFVLDINDNPIGTGFFVSQNAPGKGLFFVTARHVLESPRLFDNPKSKLRLRVNSSDGTHGEIVNILLALDGNRPWIEHKSSAVDLAVVPVGPIRFDRGFAPHPSIYSLMALDFSNRNGNTLTNGNDIGRVCFANENYRNANGIKAGSPILTMGLVPYVHFANVHLKTQRNDPSYEGMGNMPNLLVQKRGWIASIPKVPLLVFNLPGHAQDFAKSIIIDCQVVHGNSGSPVFVERECRFGNFISRRYDLLGVVSSITPDIAPPINLGSGLSSVVPVDYLCDVLESPETERIQNDIISIQQREIDAGPERQEVKTAFTVFAEKHKDVSKAMSDYRELVLRVQKVLEREKSIYGEYYKRYRTDIFDKPLDLLKNPKAYYDFD